MLIPGSIQDQVVSDLLTSGICYDLLQKQKIADQPGICDLSSALCDVFFYSTNIFEDFNPEAVPALMRYMPFSRSEIFTLIL